jgi:hypothetical protein
VEEDQEMEREDERGMAKRPDLNELDAPEWAEMALDKIVSGTCSIWRLDRGRKTAGGPSKPGDLAAAALTSPVAIRCNYIRISSVVLRQ